MSHTQIVDATPNQTGIKPVNGSGNRGRLVSASVFRKKDTPELIGTVSQTPLSNEIYYKKLKAISMGFMDHYSGDINIRNSIIRSLSWPGKPYITWMIKDRLAEVIENRCKKSVFVSLTRILSRGAIRKILSKEKKKGKALRCITSIHTSQVIFTSESLAAKAAEIAAAYIKKRGRATEILEKLTAIAIYDGEVALLRVLEYLEDNKPDFCSATSYLDLEINENKRKRMLN